MTRLAEDDAGTQTSLDDMSGVSVEKKTGRGRRANQKPHREAELAKRRKGAPAGSRRGGTDSAGDQTPAGANDANEQQHATPVGNARAVADSIDTTHQSRKHTKQAGLTGSGDERAPPHFCKGGDSGDSGSAGDDSKQPSGDSGSACKDSKQPGGKLALDRTEHRPTADQPKSAAAEAAAKTKAAKRDADVKPSRVVKINRAPVLTLWVKKVAQREGHAEDAALTFGKAISGMLAQSKGRAIGVFQEKEKDEGARHETAQEERAEVFGMKVRVARAGDSVRACGADKKALNPQQVRGYLQRAFGDDLAETESALERLAAAFPPGSVGGNGYRMYENFRPTVASGQQGWGQKADLDLTLIDSLAEHQ